MAPRLPFAWTVVYLGMLLVAVWSFVSLRDQVAGIKGKFTREQLDDALAIEKVSNRDFVYLLLTAGWPPEDPWSFMSVLKAVYTFLPLQSVELFYPTFFKVGDPHDVDKIAAVLALGFSATLALFFGSMLYLANAYTKYQWRRRARKGLLTKAQKRKHAEEMRLRENLLTSQVEAQRDDAAYIQELRQRGAGITRERHT